MQCITTYSEQKADAPNAMLVTRQLEHFMRRIFGEKWPECTSKDSWERKESYTGLFFLMPRHFFLKFNILRLLLQCASVSAFINIIKTVQKILISHVLRLFARDTPCTRFAEKKSKSFKSLKDILNQLKNPYIIPKQRNTLKH